MMSLYHSPRLVGYAPCSYRRCQYGLLRPPIHFSLVLQSTGRDSDKQLSFLVSLSRTRLPGLGNFILSVFSVANMLMSVFICIETKPEIITDTSTVKPNLIIKQEV